MKRKSFVFLLLVNLYSITLSYAVEQENHLHFEGCDTFGMWIFEAMVIVPFPVYEKHEYNYDIDLNSCNGESFFINEDKIYVKEGIELETNFDFSGTFDSKITKRTYVNEEEFFGSNFYVFENTKVRYTLQGPSSDECIEKEITFIVDKTTPCIEFISDSKNEIYSNLYNGNVSVNCFDIESELSSIEIKKDGVIVGTRYLEDDGNYIVVATDNVGNSSTKSITIDKTSPYFTVNGIIHEDENKWYTTPTLLISAIDLTSGISSVKLNNVEMPLNFYIGNGIYNLSIIDKVGNQNIAKQIKVDMTPPSLVCQRLEYRVQNGKINGIEIEVESSDHDDLNSGIEGTYIDNNGINISNEKKATINIEDRTKLQQYRISAKSKDIAGNTSTLIWDESGNREKLISVPPVLQGLIKGSYVKDGKVKTEIILKNYRPENYGYYKKISVKRKFYLPGDIEICETNFSEYYEESRRETWRALTTEYNIMREEIKTDGSEYIYTDEIDSTTGFGHMKTGYEFKWEIMDLGGQESDSEVSIEHTADSSSELELKVIGTENTEMIIKLRNDGELEYKGGSDLKIPPSGMVRMAFRIKNADLELVDIELREVVMILDDNGNDMAATVGIEGGIRNGVIKGFKATEDHTDEFVGGNWYEYENPFYLYYNKPSCYRIYVKEGHLYKGSNGRVSGQETFTSGIIRLKAEPVDLGGFRLIVGPEAGYNYMGVTAKPFQEVDLNIDAQGEEKAVFWDFGDGSNSNEKKVKHIWGQSESREGAVSNYDMYLTYGNTRALIPVNIEDTKYGRMYGNEVWRGLHQILSTITVGNGQILTIGDNTEKETRILCIGDISEGKKASLEILKGGKLKSNNGHESIVFIEGHNTSRGYEENSSMTYGWKGIQVEGEVDLKNVIIRHADRGLFVKPGAEVSCEDCSIKGGKTGIHAFKGSTIRIDDCEISGNAEYGIKEDKSSRAQKSVIRVIRGLRFENNTVDWYDADEGILSIEEIERR